MNRISVVFVIFFLVQTLALDNAPGQIRIALGLEPDSMIITWVTMKSLNAGSSPQVNYGLSADSLNMKQTAYTNHFVYVNGDQYVYNTTLPNLQYNTAYYYNVGSADGWSKTYSFKTFPSGNNFSYTIAIYGDLGYKNGTSYSFLRNAAKNGDFDIVFHIGDFAYNLYTDNGTVGDEWFNEMQEITATRPYMAIAGNHEAEGADNIYNFTHYRNRFAMPVNNKYGDNQFYSFNVGPVHYFGVSSEYYFYNEGVEQVTINQHEWLIDDLKNANAGRNNQPWIIGSMHRPIYSPLKVDHCCGSNINEYVDYVLKDGNGSMPGLEKPYLDYDVDMIFYGHVHAYERLYPVANLTLYNGTDPYHNAKAPIYICTGAGGNDEGHTVYKDPPSPWSAARFMKFGYTLLHVYNNTHMHMQQISAEDNGAVIDEVWITKDLVGCPQGWYSSSVNVKSCYFVSNDADTWDNAENKCKALGSDLVSIDSAFENNEILDVASKSNSNCDQLYIGLNNVGTEWKWINGDKNTYRNWQNGYPVFDSMKSVAVLHEDTGTWTNEDPSMAHCYMCKKSSN